MNIVIAGAGAVGFHLAGLLVTESHNIALIDVNDDLLQYASSHLDVLTVKGDAASIDVLNQSQVNNSDLFISVTSLETTNLLAAILAKKLGAKKTIARISNIEYLEENHRQNFRDVGVDSLFAPSILAALEIERLIHRCSVTDIFEFEEGKLSIIGFTADNSSALIGKTFERLDRDTPDFSIKTIVILRNGVTVIPNKKMSIQAGDHIYMVTDEQQFGKLNRYIGKTLRQVKNVMIIGDTPLALHTAQILEKNFAVTLVAQNENRCKHFVENLKHTLVINGNPSDNELLKEEGFENMDAFLALTSNSETNIITCLMAEKSGVYKTIALVDNAVYTHISQNIGVDTLINKKLIAANNIFRYVRKGKVEAIASLHGVDAEIIEFVIHKNNRVTKLPLRALHFPENAVIAGVVRDDLSFIPNGDSQLAVNDKVIVFVLPSAMRQVEKIFK